MICKHCYKVFLDNIFGNIRVFSTNEERENFIKKIKVMRGDQELKFVKISEDMSQEEFEEAKKDKYNSYFLELREKNT